MSRNDGSNGDNSEHLFGLTRLSIIHGLPLNVDDPIMCTPIITSIL